MGGQGGQVTQVGQGATGHATVPDKSRADVAIHGFWEWVTSTIFDMRIFNLDMGSFLCQASVKALTIVEKQKKDKCLQPCLERMHVLAPMLYSRYSILSTESVAAKLCLASFLSNKLKQEYL